MEQDLLPTPTADERSVERFLDDLCDSVAAEKYDQITDCLDTYTFGEDSLQPGVLLEIMDDGQPNRLWLNNLTSRKRRNGHARKVLQTVCHLADRHGITLSLGAKAHNPFGRRRPTRNNGFLSTDDLVCWYERYGFRSYAREDEQILMERKPREDPPSG